MVLDEDRLQQARAALAGLGALVADVEVVFDTVVADLIARSALQHHDATADDGGHPGRLITALSHVTNGPPHQFDAA